MKARTPHAYWLLVYTLAVCPLLALGPCAGIGVTSVIQGFFNATTPLLVDNLRQELGLEPITDEATTETSPTDSFTGIGA